MDICRITAIHEAAHAVAAIRTGLVFDHVTAIPDDDLEIDGALNWSELQASGQLEVPRELLAVVLLAGPCAEARETERELEDVFDDVEAADDREGLTTLALTADQFLQASRETLALLDEDWALIERVADELMRGPLGYDDVVDIVAADTPPA